MPQLRQKDVEDLRQALRWAIQDHEGYRFLSSTLVALRHCLDVLSDPPTDASSASPQPHHGTISSEKDPE